MSVAEETDPGSPDSHYDEIAEGYSRHWGPVIRPGAELVLDLVAPAIEATLPEAQATRLVDIGTGTGTLAIAALERWPAIRVTGIDPSGGMLALARKEAAERLAPTVADRFATEVAPADRLPFDDATVEHAVSSFVLQLVQSRAAALREVLRILRPGGTFAWAAWQHSDVPYEPDRIANDELDQAGFDPPEGGGRPGDIASAEAAAAGMRRAGFRDVRAHIAELAHQWDAAGYLAFFTQFDEESLFADLDPNERLDIERRIRRRLDRLTPEQLTLRMPVIYVTGRAPG
ncbi:MAG TPA: class I SAM-dependent methyltransferase [Candidatus Limnocylindria bacterium]|nr:class I SAM-dependent methyltransferase [Candidatus Limnocylindria bacterium]